MHDACFFPMKKCIVLISFVWYEFGATYTLFLMPMSFQQCWHIYSYTAHFVFPWLNWAKCILFKKFFFFYNTALLKEKLGSQKITFSFKNIACVITSVRDYVVAHDVNIQPRMIKLNVCNNKRYMIWQI